MRRLVEDKKGISPVITTVIIVAVGIAVAIAVALWMSGLVATLTRFEKLEITSAYALSKNGTWEVYVTIKNTGSADATITSVMINGIPSDAWDKGGSSQPDPASSPVTVNVGSSASFTITLNKSGKIGTTTLTSGITLNIVFHTAAGKDYPTSVTLP